MPGDGAVDDGSGNATLRGAIQEANALFGDDTIMLPAGTIQLSIAGDGEDLAATGDLDITESVTISGAGATDTIIDINDLDRIFHIHSGAIVTLENLTLQDARVTGGFENGGAVSNQGTLVIQNTEMRSNQSGSGGGALFNADGASLTVNDTVLEQNAATGISGGGVLLNNGIAVFNNSTLETNSTTSNGGAIVNIGVNAELTVIDSTLTDNRAGTSSAGGGIFTTSLVTIVRSTFDINRAANGGGIWIGAGTGNASVVNSTFSGNFASSRGGGFYLSQNGDQALVNFSTITENFGGASGGGVFSQGAFATENSIIVDNNSGGFNNEIDGGWTSLGYNLLHDSLGSSNPDDLLTSDPGLSPLTDNGGPTETHALNPGSPALDAADPMEILNIDQRGEPRPEDADGDGAAVHDIGAYEVGPLVYTAPSSTNMRARLNGADFEILDDDTMMLLHSAPFFPGSSITINGSAEDDSLTIDFSGGNPVPAGDLIFNGLADTGGGDSLALELGTFQTVTHDFLNSSDGSIILDDGFETRTVVYTGLEPIADNLNVTDRVFDFQSTDDIITLADDGMPGNGITQISSVSSSELVDFSNPTGSLTVNSGGGNDTVNLDAVDSGFVASLAVDAGSGNDTVTAALLTIAVQVTGGDGNDTLTGGSGADELIGNSGGDSIMGGSGDDSLFGGAQRDFLSGDDGDDMVYGNGSTLDTISGGLGDDTLTGAGIAGGGNDRLFEEQDADMTLLPTSLSGIGNDVLDGITSAILIGGASANTLDASGFNRFAILIGGSGDDTLIGGTDFNTLTGNGESDTLIGNSREDTIRGGAGSDSLVGNAGNDRLFGQGASNDTLSGGAGNDLLDGGAGGGDTLVEVGGSNYTATATTLTGVGNDNLVRLEKLILTSGSGDDVIDVDGFGGRAIIVALGGNDTIIGTAGDDQIFGGDGDDTIRGRAGNDRLFGELGNDTLNGGVGNDTLEGGDGHDGISGWTGDDMVDGGLGFDQIFGGDGDDSLNGFNGRDTIQGGDGADTLDGRGGVDTLTGGSGDGSADPGDTFIGPVSEIDENFNVIPTPAWIDDF